MNKYAPFIIIAAAFIWGAVCYYNDADWIAYVPCLLLLLWAFDFGRK